MVFAHGYIPLSPCQQRFPFSNHDGRERVGYSCRCPDSKEVAQELTYQEAEISNGKIHLAKLGHGVRQMDAYFFCMQASLCSSASPAGAYGPISLLVIDSSPEIYLWNGNSRSDRVEEDALWATMRIVDT